MVFETFHFSIHFQLYLNQFALHRCHGEQDNVVYEMAKDSDLLARNRDLDRLKTPKYIRSNGEEIPPEIYNKLYDLFDSIYDGDDLAEEQKNFHGSRGNFFAEK